MRDWDDAFANMAYVPGSEALPARWAEEAATYRASGITIETDIPYGDGARERFDLIMPEGTPKGLAVFVHGGYWMKLSKSDWTPLAEGARRRGWAVALPGYTLAPEAQIGEITTAIGRAITSAAARVPGPIRLSGHSAGGHLVSRMICMDSPLSADVAERIEHTLSISGVHDLRPMIHTAMNETLGLTMDSASAESPVLHRPVPGANFTAWVGGGERPEFIRQAHLLAEMWGALDADVSFVLDSVHNHFSVVEGLKDPGSAICEAFCGPG